MQILKKIKHYVAIILQQKHPIRFIISRILTYTKLSTKMILKRNQYKLIFFTDSALTASLWIDPKTRLSEEQFLQNLVR
ncbi:MAG: hypothetical protein AAF403_07245, partial [Pseudomonadota bacterium]